MPTINAHDLKMLRSQAFDEYCAVADQYLGAPPAKKIFVIEGIFSKYMDLSTVDVATMFYRAVDENIAARVNEDDAGGCTTLFRPTLPLLNAVLEDLDLVEDLPFDFMTHIRFMRTFEWALVEHEYHQEGLEPERKELLHQWVERYRGVQMLYPLHFVVATVQDDIERGSHKFSGYIALLKHAGLVNDFSMSGDSMSP